MPKLENLVLLCVLIVLLPAVSGANSLDVNADAALPGSGSSACDGHPCGLEVLITDQNPAYVASTHPDAESHVVITFHIDPNTITMPTFGPDNLPGRMRVLKAFSDAASARQHLFVTLKRNRANTAYRMAVLQRNNNGNFAFVGEFYIGNNDHNHIQIFWTAGNPGTVVAYRNGEEKARSENLNFASHNIDEVRLGAPGGDPDAITPGINGSIYLDSYISTR